MAPVTRIYKCADGRDFPVTFDSEDAAATVHEWDPEHNPTPLTPLDEVIWRDCAAGSGRARSEVGFDPSDVFIGGSGTVSFNGFTYWRYVPPTDQALARRDVANERLRDEYADMAVFWQRWCQPRSMRAVQQLREAGPETPIPELLDAFGYGYEQTFLMWGMLRDTLGEYLKQEMGDEGNRIASELTQGYPTATLEANQALWELAQEAPPVVRDLLTADGAVTLERIAGSEGGAAFVEGFNRYLDAYGWRTQGWDPSTPTLREQPEVSLEVIRRTLLEDLPEPAALVAAAADARERQVEELETAFRGDPAKLEEFRKRLRAQTAYLTVKEGRALWQLSLNGAIRHAMLRKGEELRRLGALAATEDVFFLLPDEIEAGLTGQVAGLSDAARKRRAEHERWVGVTPPARVGGPEEGEGAPAAGATEVRGRGVSRGVASGTARVLRSIEEHSRLQAGDVLVCPTTTPSWTPLFALAAAVVAEGGGMLSHTAIAAREYGIPAVAGARLATQLIPDGARVTVDGTTGVVGVET